MCSPCPMRGPFPRWRRSILRLYGCQRRPASRNVPCATGACCIRSPEPVLPLDRMLGRCSGQEPPKLIACVPASSLPIEEYHGCCAFPPWRPGFLGVASLGLRAPAPRPTLSVSRPKCNRHDRGCYIPLASAAGSGFRWVSTNRPPAATYFFLLSTVFACTR
jgi:hypothetical protein